MNRLQRSASAWRAFVVGLLLVAALLAYSNSFAVPFLFDDHSAIPQNASLRSRSTWLTPPADTTVSGRPLLNLSFGINHAVGGEKVFGYHVVNLALHVGAAVFLYGIVRRTLERQASVLGDHAPPNSALGDRTSGGGARPPGAFFAGQPSPRVPELGAFGVALLWLVHPLQTESVTYIVQRAESLAGFLYLATLYTFVRGVTDVGPGNRLMPAPRVAPASAGTRWLVASVVLCTLGMAAKETMVSAPLLVLLYDRTFIAGSFRAAWERRRGYYLALAATWILLAYLVAGTQGRSGSAGFNAEVSPWHYLLTQAAALRTYVTLTGWPHPLVFDYGIRLITTPVEVWLEALVILLALAATAWALVRRPALGFLGAWFFCLLAPTSSFVPVATQTMAEHRVYLAIAAPAALLVIGLVRVVGPRALPTVFVAAAALAVLTHARNGTYREPLTIWSDTVAKQPENGRAHYGVGAALAQLGRDDEAIAAFRRSIALDPLSVEAHNNLGVLLQKSGRAMEAAEVFAAALQLDPQDPEANTHLGGLLAAQGRPAEALGLLERALPRWRDRAPLHVNYGGVLLQLGRTAAAFEHLTTAVTLDPRNAEAHYNLGLIRLQARDFAAAAEHFRAVLRVAPQDQGARDNLAYCEAQSGKSQPGSHRGTESPGYPKR